MRTLCSSYGFRTLCFLQLFSMLRYDDVIMYIVNVTLKLFKFLLHASEFLLEDIIGF